MDYSINRDLDANLSFIRISGDVGLPEIGAVRADFYAGETTADVIWDFSDADLGQVRTENLRSFVQSAADLAEQRIGGRTALVMPGDLMFGFARMVQVYAEQEGVAVTFRVVRSRAEAESWLGKFLGDS